MNRREFIAGLGGTVAWPLGALAQQGERVRRVGFLSYGYETDYGPAIRRFWRDALEHLGWSEGRNLRLDFRYGDGDARKTSAFAADLVRLAPDVIVTRDLVALLALLEETKTVPIVVNGNGDLVVSGAVRNTARPEGNVTGFTNAFGSLGGKWLDLLKEVAPNITRVLHIYPSSLGDISSGYRRSVETAAQSLGVLVVPIPVRDAASVKAAIEGFAAELNGGLVASPATFAIVPWDELSRLAV